MASGIPSRAAWVPTKKISSGSKAPSRFLNTAGRLTSDRVRNSRTASSHSRTLAVRGEKVLATPSHASMASGWRPEGEEGEATRHLPVAAGLREHLLEVAALPERVDDPGGQVGIEPLSLAMGSQGSLEQARVAAGVHEAREQLRVVARLAGQAQQADHGLLRTAASPPPHGRRACGRGVAAG